VQPIVCGRGRSLDRSHNECTRKDLNLHGSPRRNLKTWDVQRTDANGSISNGCKRWLSAVAGHWRWVPAIRRPNAASFSGLRGLVRYFVLFIIGLKTRLVHIGGVIHEAYGQWMEQVARSLTDPADGFLRDKRYLIHDREPLFTGRFVGILEAAGVKSVMLPARSPNLNSYAERFVLSGRRECLNRVIPFSEKHLRKIVFEFVDHYHLERNHQGLGNQLIDATLANAPNAGRIKCRERLGGVLNFYFREAA